MCHTFCIPSKYVFNCSSPNILNFEKWLGLSKKGGLFYVDQYILSTIKKVDIILLSLIHKLIHILNIAVLFHIDYILCFLCTN